MDNNTTLAIQGLRHIAQTGKTKVPLLKTITALSTLPTPIGVKISKVYVPRRGDVLLEGMNEKDGTGRIKAEWLDYLQPEEAVRDETGQLIAKGSVVLYLHGGSYTLFLHPASFLCI